MVSQKRLEYGFNGYQVPPTPRAPRSARKRVKKYEDYNRMCTFDLLATIACHLLSEVDDSVNEINHEEINVINETTIKTENDSSKTNVCDEGSYNKNFFVSEIIKAPVIDTYSGPAYGITVSDSKIEGINDKQIKIGEPKNGMAPVVNNSDCNFNLVIRDDDENSCGCTQKTFRLPNRNGDRRIKRLSATKQWKVASNTDVYRNKKSCYRYKRSIRDYPFKKRKLYQLDNPSNSSIKFGSIEDDSSLGQDSHVKLKIKSFRVPEFFIEIPETATISSLKRSVTEAVTAIFSGDLHVGVMIQGKSIRDDNKTLLQMGICHDNKLDALGFSLEPNELQVPTLLYPEDQSMVPPTGTPKQLTRYSPPKTVQLKVPDALLDSPVKSSRNARKSDVGMSVESRALVTDPAINSSALAVIPIRKSMRAEVAQRRSRRPFSISEVEALVEAVERVGTGRWRDVKLCAFDDAKHRTYVDLKDKWKTLVHTATISPQQRRGAPVPQELLDRVLTAHGYWSVVTAPSQEPVQPLIEN